jgi:hypothetical protein
MRQFDLKGITIHRQDYLSMIPISVLQRHEQELDEYQHNQLLAEAFLGPCTFAAVLEAAGFPSLGNLDVGGDLFGDGGDVHIAETVVKSRDVVRIADGGVVLPV